MIYTEIESHRASLRERVKVVLLIWRAAGEPDIPPRQRRWARRHVIWVYLHPRARVSQYLVNWNGGTT